MAIFRKVHTSFWSDPFVMDLDKEKKLFYLYLLTNERTKQCGVYEISKRQMSFDLGVSIDTINKLLNHFISCDKILYHEDTQELALRNWFKFNRSSSPKVLSCINKEFEDVKNEKLIDYVKGDYKADKSDIHTLEVKPKKAVSKDTIQGFLDWFNNKKSKHTGKRSNIKNLSETDKKNLKKLRGKYEPNDFNQAFSALVRNDWAIKNKAITPTHFLVEDNFNRYFAKGEDIESDSFDGLTPSERLKKIHNERH